MVLSPSQSLVGSGKTLPRLVRLAHSSSTNSSTLVRIIHLVKFNTGFIGKNDAHTHTAQENNPSPERQGQVANVSVSPLKQTQASP